MENWSLTGSAVGSLADGVGCWRSAAAALRARLRLQVLRALFAESTTDCTPDGDLASHVTNRQRMMLWLGHQSVASHSRADQ